MILAVNIKFNNLGFYRGGPIEFDKIMTSGRIIRIQLSTINREAINFS